MAGCHPIRSRKGVVDRKPRGRPLAGGAAAPSVYSGSFYINGACHASRGGGTFDVTNPANGAVVASADHEGMLEFLETERQWRDVDGAGIRLFVLPRVPDGVAASDAAARGAVEHLAFAVASVDAAIGALTVAGTPVMKRFSNLGPVSEQPLLKDRAACGSCLPTTVRQPRVALRNML